jgi:hypothetical protein
MSNSEQRRAANRTNALQSTGPRTANGKAIASRNATRHGLLSTKLVLDDEEPGQFDHLLADLQRALHPVGAVELALVERIAVTMWRQRRLVHAETAALALSRQDGRIAGDVSKEMGLGYGRELKAEDLAPVDSEQAAWCQSVLEAAEGLEYFELASLPKAAPIIFAQLTSDAEDEEGGIEAHLKHYNRGLTGYVNELANWCREELKKMEQRPRILALAAQARAKRLVLSPDTLDLFTRYQTTLDNQLYKALRALREAQDWRLRMLEAVPALEEAVESEAE